MKFFRKLNSRGVAHHFALVVVVLGVAIGGTAWLVANYADSVQLNSTDIDNIVSDCTFMKDAGTNHGMANATTDYDNCKAGIKANFESMVSSDTSTLPASVKASNASACTIPTADLNTISNTTIRADEKAHETTDCAAPANAQEPAHIYEGHIVHAVCNDIEIEGQDTGSASTGNLEGVVALTGGPYSSQVNLGPNVLNDPDISGSGSTFHHWATPVAITSASTSDTIKVTMFITDQGKNIPSYSSADAIVTMHGCTAPSKVNPITTQKAEHLYEGHMVLMTCNDIEVEAHDSGSQASQQMGASVQLTGGPYSTPVTMPIQLTNSKNISGTSLLNEYTHWPTPIYNYTEKGTITAKLTIYDNNATVANTASAANQTMTLTGPCDTGTTTGGGTKAPGSPGGNGTQSPGSPTNGPVVGTGDSGSPITLTIPTDTDANGLTPAQEKALKSALTSAEEKKKIHEAAAKHADSQITDMKTQISDLNADIARLKKLKASHQSDETSLEKTKTTDANTVNTGYNTCLNAHVAKLTCEVWWSTISNGLSGCLTTANSVAVKKSGGSAAAVSKCDSTWDSYGLRAGAIKTKLAQDVQAIENDKQLINDDNAGISADQAKIKSLQQEIGIEHTKKQDNENLVHNLADKISALHDKLSGK